MRRRQRVLSRPHKARSWRRTVAEDVLEAALVVVVAVRRCAGYSGVSETAARSACCWGRTRVVDRADVDDHVQLRQARRVARAHNLRVLESLRAPRRLRVSASPRARGRAPQRRACVRRSSQQPSASSAWNVPSCVPMRTICAVRSRRQSLRQSASRAATQRAAAMEPLDDVSQPAAARLAFGAARVGGGAHAHAGSAAQLRDARGDGAGAGEQTQAAQHARARERSAGEWRDVASWRARGGPCASFGVAWPSRMRCAAAASPRGAILLLR